MSIENELIKYRAFMILKRRWYCGTTIEINGGKNNYHDI